MSAGADEQQLDAHLDAQSADHQDQVWLCHLWKVSRTLQMHPGEASPLGDKKRILREMLPENENRLKRVKKSMPSGQA